MDVEIGGNGRVDALEKRLELGGAVTAVQEPITWPVLTSNAA